MVVVWLTLSCVCAALFLYPYLVYPIFLKMLPAVPINTGDTPNLTASLLFCAFNEESSITEKVKNLEELKISTPELVISAFDDGSTDKTFELLNSRPDLLTVIQGGGRSGKAHGMKILAAKSHSDILIFTDANVILDRNIVNILMKYFGDETVGGVCGTLRYSSKDNTATSEVGSLYWRLEEYLKALESRTGNVMGADGSIFAIRRVLYPDFPDTVLDDLTVSMSTVFSGYRLVRADDVLAFENLVSNRGDEFRRKVRISARAFHTHQFLRREILKMSPVDKFKYFSRKYLRWFGGAFLLSGAAFLLAAALSYKAVAFFILLALYATAAMAIYFSKSGPLSKIGEVIIAIMATLFGVVQAIQGRTYVTWKPASSR